MEKKSNPVNSLIDKSREAEASLGYDSSLELLEQAHIISQPSSWPHLYVHWLMLKLAVRHRRYKEAIGQVPRLLLAVPGSLFGLAPNGNVGSTKMGIFEKKP